MVYAVSFGLQSRCRLISRGHTLTYHSEWFRVRLSSSEFSLGFLRCTKLGMSCLSIHRSRLIISGRKQILYWAVSHISSGGSSLATSVNFDTSGHYNMSLSWFGSVKNPPQLSNICVPSRSVQRYPPNSYTLCRGLGFPKTPQNCSVNYAVWYHVGDITSSRGSWGYCTLLSMARGVLCIDRGPGYCLVWNILTHARSTAQKS